MNCTSKNNIEENEWMTVNAIFYINESVNAIY